MLDNSKPIAYQRICELPEEAASVFEELKLTDYEKAWKRSCTMSMPSKRCEKN